MTRSLLLTAAIAATSLTLAACGGSTASRSTTAPVAARARVFTAPSPAAVPARPPQRPAPTRSAAATARAFTAAFGFYEIGQDSKSTVAGLRANATAQLVASLLAQPVRGRPDLRRARPTRVLLSGLQQPVGQLAATVMRDDGSSLDLQLARPRGVWLVSAVTPGQLARSAAASA